MSSEDFSRVRRLFEAAMNLPASQQEAFVQRFCVDDSDLRDEVIGLLDSDREMDSARQLLDEGGLKRSSVVEIPEKIGPYRAVSVIASGGMGMVYEGLQESPRRRVAIKTLLIGPKDDRALARFQSEIDVLARLEHPNIARIYSAGTYEQKLAGEARELPYYVMEYIEGAATLTEYAEREQLSVRQRIQLFCTVCEAVDFAHKQGVLHRDLKPGNILVNREGMPKVIDFGTARLLGEDSMIESGMTRSGEIIGTLNYMSPEQLSPSTENPPDARADVYALGCLLYELLAGRPARIAKGGTFAEMVASVLFGKLESPSHWVPDLSRALDLVCLKALRQKREDRYTSAADFSADLERFLDAREVKAVPPSIGIKFRLFMRRQPAIVAAVCVFLLANGTGVFFMRRAKATQAYLETRVEEAVSRLRTDSLRDAGVRDNSSVLLGSLSEGELHRDNIETYLVQLNPMAGIQGLDEQVVVALESEVVAAIAADLQSYELAESFYREAQEALASAPEKDRLAMKRVGLAQLIVEHAGGLEDRQIFAERLSVFEREFKELDPGCEVIRLRIEHLKTCLLFEGALLFDSSMLLRGEELPIDKVKLSLACDSARALYSEQERVMGENSVDTCETAWLLGRVLLWEGRTSAALTQLEKAHAGFLLRLGPLHPKTLACQVDNATTRSELNMPSAHEMLVDAEAKLSLVLGEEHHLALFAKSYLESRLSDANPSRPLYGEASAHEIARSMGAKR